MKPVSNVAPARPAPPRSVWPRRLSLWLREVNRRFRHRAQLARISDADLRDIGRTREEIEAERLGIHPFRDAWQAVREDETKG